MCAEAEQLHVDGAGTAADVNLRTGDKPNIGVAQAADVPVVLVADIERGGVIESVVGTWQLLGPTERARLAGYIINKFRGDVSLFGGGIAIIGRETGLASFGIVPHFADARRLPAEDAMAVDSYRAEPRPGTVRVAVPVLSRIANFDDFDPLRAEPDLDLDFVEGGRALPGDADLVVLPGSKATLADLAFLRAQGWDIDIAAHVRRGGVVLGICGGFQMLGRRIADPGGIEGEPGAAAGLSLLDAETELGDVKTLTEVHGEEAASGSPVHGFEMHVGRTMGAALSRPFLRLGGRPEGAISADGRVYGCYVHGLFASDAFRHAFLARLRVRHASGICYEAEVDRALDGLADHLEHHLDLDAVLGAAQPPGGQHGHR
jgi:adenosylcobyric acid synthase